MGGSSTSHSAVLRREHGGPAYDLRSWQGLTDVLRVAKETLSPAEHASFRDLVLSYAQRGGDVELKAQIDAVIARLHASQESNEPEPEPAPRVISDTSFEPAPSSHSGMNARQRPAPRFLPKSIAYEEAPRVPEEEISAEPMRVSESEPNPSQMPEPVVVREPNSEPMETSDSPQPPVEETPVVSRSLEEHKARILEIKRLVNEQIGNPVALVGTHKEIGKAYMQALLTALKATGGGGTGVESAMRRLEDAYSALLTDKPSAKKEIPTEAPAEVASPTIERVADEPMVMQEKVQAPEPEIVKEKPLSISEESVEEPTPKPVPQPRPVVVSETPARHIPVIRSTPSSFGASRPEPRPAQPTPIQKVNPPLPKAPSAFSAAATHASLTQHAETPSSVPDRSRSAPSERTAADSGLSGTKYTQKKIGATSAEALAENGIDGEQIAVRQSELVSPEITQALHALLHEWNIFASSGLFGIGPSGPEHPLYAKLAPLTMGEIITGRYEGADRQINNVIHDYVNAWRHEQGIAYTPSETFEHYLRRVVQRIQKRQART